MRTWNVLLTTGLLLSCVARATPAAEQTPAAGPVQAAPPPPVRVAPAAANAARVSFVLWSGAERKEADAWLARAKRAVRSLNAVYSQRADKVRVEPRPEGSYDVVLATCDAQSPDVARGLAVLQSIYPQVRVRPAEGGAPLSCPGYDSPIEVRTRRVVQRDGWQAVFLSYYRPFASFEGTPNPPGTGLTTVGAVLLDPGGTLESVSFKDYAHHPQVQLADVEDCSLTLGEAPEELSVQATCRRLPQPCAKTVTLLREETRFVLVGIELRSGTEVLERKVSPGCELAD